MAAAPVDPATFPAEVLPEFRAAALELARQIAQLRFRLDGGDLEALDAVQDEVADEGVYLGPEDVREMIAGFHADGDQARYSACCAVFDWLAFEAARRATLN